MEWFKSSQLVDGCGLFTIVVAMWLFYFYNCCSIVENRGWFTIISTCGWLWFVYNFYSHVDILFTTVTTFWKAMDCLQSSPRVGGCGLFTIVVAMWLFFFTIVAALWNFMDCLQTSPLADGCGLFTFVAALCFLQLLQHCGRSWIVYNGCNLLMVLVCLQLL